MSLDTVNTVDITTLAQEQTELTTLLGADPTPLAGTCSTGTVKKACPVATPAWECDVCVLVSTEADAVAAFKVINDAAIANGAKGAEGCVKIGGETVTMPKATTGTAEDVVVKCMPAVTPTPDPKSAVFLKMVSSVVAATMMMHF